MIRKVAILANGGDVSGFNAVIRAIVKTAENNILFFTGKSKTANKLVDDMQKKIDTLKGQLSELEKKINLLDAE